MTEQTKPQTFQVFNCGYCNETGHTIKDCHVLAEKKTNKKNASLGDYNVPELSNLFHFPYLGQNSTSTSNVQTSWGSNKREQDQIVPTGQEPNVSKLQLSCGGIDRWYIGGVLASNEEVMEHLWPGEYNCSWTDDDGGMNQ